MGYRNSNRKLRKGDLLFALLGVGVLFYAIYRLLPNPHRLMSEYPHVYYQGVGEEPRIELKRERPGTWVPLKSISKKAVWAVLVSEDWAFYQHEGLDWEQIQEAAEKNLKKGKYVRGASTISQQVVKNVFLTREKTISRKLNEVLLTLWMEQVIPKWKILEVYFNVVEWGEGIYGIGPAAAFYFKKQPSELTAKEGAFLAMLLPSPKRYSESYRARRLTPYATKTIDSILTKLMQAHVLSEEEGQEASLEKFPFIEEGVSWEN